MRWPGWTSPAGNGLRLTRNLATPPISARSTALTCRTAPIRLSWPASGGRAACCAAIVRGSDRLDVNRAVRRLMGVSRASFASAEETRQLTGMMIGGVTALALPPELPIYADARLLEMDYIILGAGSRSAKLKMPPAELGKLPGLQFIAGLSLAAP